MNKNYLIIGLIILALVTIGVIASRPGEEIVSDGTGGATDTTPTAEEPSIHVSAQTLSSEQVVIDRVFSETDGWLMIHRVDENGEPDTSSNIGYTRVASGNNSGILIDLTEEVESNEVLIAMLYIDAGEFGVLETEGEDAADTPVLIDGEVVEAPFTVVLAGEEAETDELEEGVEEVEETDTETTEE